MGVFPATNTPKEGATPNKSNKLDKKVHFLSNTTHLLNKKSYFYG